MGILFFRVFKLYDDLIYSFQKLCTHIGHMGIVFFHAAIPYAFLKLLSEVQYNYIGQRDTLHHYEQSFYVALNLPMKQAFDHISHRDT